MSRWRVTYFSCTMNRSYTVEVRAADRAEAYTKAMEQLYDRGYYGRLIKEDCRRII